MPSSDQLKRGPFSAKERAVVDDALRARVPMEPEELAPRLRRSVDSVRRQMEKQSLSRTMAAAGKSTMPLAEQLKNRPEWEQLEAQFTDEELEFFLYRYVQLMGQFGRDGVLHTEEIMIFQLISNEIVTNRSLAGQKYLVGEVARLQEELELLDEDDSKSRSRARALREQIEVNMKSLGDAKRGLDGSLKQTQSFLKDLKGLREQRIKQLESAGTSFVEFLRALQDEDFRAAQDEDMELVRRAAEKERARLSRPHTYLDGTVEPPLLTPETVLALDDQHA